MIEEQIKFVFGQRVFLARTQLSDGVLVGAVSEKGNSVDFRDLHAFFVGGPGPEPEIRAADVAVADSVRRLARDALARMRK